MTVDHNLAFRDEQTAIDDSVVGKYYSPPVGDQPGGWDQSCCNFNTLIWDPADDTTETIDTPDGPIDVVTHHPIDDQFRITITLAEADQALVDHKSTELAVDHETGEVLRTSFTAPQRASLMMSPVFVGSTYPFLEPDGKGLTR